jgi:hypothetical protein
MPDLLANPADENFADEVRERLLTLAERLDEPIGPNGRLGAIIARRNDCREALSFAIENPAAARLLTPLLIRVLGNELARNYSSSIDELLYRDPSKQIQIYVPAIIARIAGHDLVRQYRRAEETLGVALRTLADGVIAGRSSRTRAVCVIAVARILRVRPELAGTHLSIEPFTTSVADITAAARVNPITIPDEERGQILRANPDSSTALLINVAQPDLRIRATRHVLSTAGLLVIAAIATRDPQAVPKTASLTNALQAAEGDGIESALVGLICRSSEVALPDKHQQYRDPVLTLSEGIREQTATKTAPIVLGELVALQPDDAMTSDLPPSGKVEHVRTLRRHIRTREGAERRSAAQALGAVLPHLVHEGDAELRAQLKRGAKGDAESVNQDLAATGVGYLTLIEERVTDPVIVALIDAIQDVSPADRYHAIRLLGQVRTHRDIEEYEPLLDHLSHLISDPDQSAPRLRGRGTGTTRTELRLAALTMGEILATTETPDLDPRLVALLDRVCSTSGPERQRLARILGEVVVRFPEPEQIQHRIRDNSANDRNTLAEIWGEVLAAQPHADDGPVPQLSRRVRSEEGDARQLSAIALGEIATIQYFTDDPLIEILSARVQAGRGLERARAAQFLGEVAAIRDVQTQDALVQHFSDIVQNEDIHRRQFASKTLGEITAIRTAKPTEDVATVLRRWVTATRGDNRRQLARALGEIVAAHPDQFVAPGLEPLQSQLEQTDGEERRRIARIIGEITAIDIESGDVVPALHEAIQDSMGPERRLRCELVGEILIVSGRIAEQFSEQTQSHFHDILGRDRSRVAYMLGEMARVHAEENPKETIQWLRRQARTSSGEDRRRTMVLLGEVIAVEPGATAGPTMQYLVTRLRTITGHERMLTARAIGELATTPNQSPTTAIEKLLKRLGDLRSASSRTAETIQQLVEATGVGGAELITVLERASTGGGTLQGQIQSDTALNLDRYFLMGEQTSKHLFQAVDTALETDATNVPAEPLRQQLQSYLVDESGRASETRLAIVSILTRLP